jgi:hypothetical protein
MEGAKISKRTLLETVLTLEVEIIAIGQVELKQSITASNALVTTEKQRAITFETVFGVGAYAASGFTAVDLNKKLAVADETVRECSGELLRGVC